MNILKPHVSLNVSNIDASVAAWTRFKNAGLKTRTEDNATCCYALQDKVWVEDPDGNMWEVFVVKGDAATMHENPAETSAACCAPASIDADKPVQLTKKSGCG